MKKFFTLALSLFTAASASFAQEEINNVLQFVDKDGKVVADGSTITVATVEIDEEMDDLQIPSGLYVKKTTDETVFCGMEVTVLALPNGSLNCCFPQSCQSGTAAGQVLNTAPGNIIEPEKSMETEWVPIEGAYGTATGKFRIMIYELTHDLRYIFLDYGPTVTVNFVYDETSGINNATAAGTVNEVARYGLDGSRLAQPTKGINLVKTADGKVRKVLVK